MSQVRPSAMHGSGNTTQAAGYQVHVNQATPVSGSKPGVVAVADRALTVNAAYAKTRTQASGSSTGVDLVHDKV